MSLAKKLGALFGSGGALVDPALIPRLSGAVVQMQRTQTGAVSTGTTIFPNDDTIPQNNEGIEVMTQAITPTSAASKLKIEVVVNLSFSLNNGWMAAGLFQDSTANALAAVTTFQGTGTGMSQLTLTHVMTAGTTSPTTFKVRIGGHVAGTITFNGLGGVRNFGGVVASSITVTELAA
jgi:hypothetical protein